MFTSSHTQCFFEETRWVNMVGWVEQGGSDLYPKQRQNLTTCWRVFGQNVFSLNAEFNWQIQIWLAGLSLWMNEMNNDWIFFFFCHSLLFHWAFCCSFSFFLHYFPLIFILSPTLLLQCLLVFFLLTFDIVLSCFHMFILLLSLFFFFFQYLHL